MAGNVSAYLSATETARAAEFKRVADEIENMVDTIGNSSICGYSGTDTAKLDNKAALEGIQSTLEGLLSHNPPLGNCNQRPDFGWNTSGEAILNNSGVLYEYYLGCVPATSGA